MRPKVVDKLLSQMTTKYRKVSPLTVSRYCVHDYLDMRLYYGTKGKVHITMPKDIEGILEAEAEDMNGITESPSANNLFQVQEDGGTLKPVKANLF